MNMDIKEQARRAVENSFNLKRRFDPAFDRAVRAAEAAEQDAQDAYRGVGAIVHSLHDMRRRGACEEKIAKAEERLAEAQDEAQKIYDRARRLAAKVCG